MDDERKRELDGLKKEAGRQEEGFCSDYKNVYCEIDV